MKRSAIQSPLASHQSAPAASLSSGSGGNNHNVISDPCAINAEGRDPFRDDLTDQSRALVIPITLGGIRGAITARFIDFRPFHDPLNSEGYQYDLA